MILVWRKKINACSMADDCKHAWREKYQTIGSSEKIKLNTLQ